MRTALLLTPIVLSLTAGAVPAPAAVTRALAGTYVIRTCRHACAPGDTLAGAPFVVLVLSPSAIDVQAVPDSARGYLTDSFMFFTAADRPPNACWADIAPGHQPDAGLSHWAPSGPMRAHVDLERSPDSGWSLDLEVHGDIVSGTMRFWAVSDPNPTDLRRVITGRRIGAPDLRPCADSALAADRALYQKVVHALRRARSHGRP